MSEKESRAGLLQAIAAFSLWGLVPIYFKALDHVLATEILAHRVLWSAILLMLILAVRGHLAELKAVFRSPKILGLLTLSSVLIAINWLSFIWGVANDLILETSLGYFINPLISVLVGYLFLRERMSPMRFLAVMLAVVAVLIQIFMLGRIPWVAFSVAFSFGFYGLVRKLTSVNAVPGLATETLILLPPAVVYMYWLNSNGQNHFTPADPETTGLLFLAGIVTTVPLICFNLAAKRLSLTVLGILQYLGPSLSFMVGAFVYHEPLETAQMITFSLIWLALAIFTTDGIRHQKNKRKKRHG